MAALVLVASGCGTSRSVEMDLAVVSLGAAAALAFAAPCVLHGRLVVELAFSTGICNFWDHQKSLKTYGFLHILRHCDMYIQALLLSASAPRACMCGPLRITLLTRGGACVRHWHLQFLGPSKIA
jgi:hypothetical protein